MSTTPTYSEPSEIDPSLPDENEPARRSKSRTTRNDSKVDAEVNPATLQPDPPLAG